jgi:hypothetical protein
MYRTKLEQTGQNLQKAGHQKPLLSKTCTSNHFNMESRKLPYFQRSKEAVQNNGCNEEHKSS